MRNEVRRAAWVGAVIGACLVLAAGYAGWRFRSQRMTTARFSLLNFAVGTIETARFGADGRTLFYSLRVGGQAPEIFAYDPRESGPRDLGLHNAHLLSVSAKDELALCQAPSPVLDNQFVGTLAVASGAGGAPRVVREGVAEAVWDGGELACIIVDGAFHHRLEFPAGRTVDSWNLSQRIVSNLTLSRDGQLLACVDADSAKGVTTLKAYRRGGGQQVLHTLAGDASGAAFTGLVWGPGGELWVSQQVGDQTEVWTLTLAGARRVLWRSQGTLQLLDVSREGRALLAQQTRRRSVYGLREGEPPRDLSIQRSTQVRGLSADGRLVLLNESPVQDGGSPEDRCFVGPLDGGPPQSLGKGYGGAISGDGRWVSVDCGSVPLRDLDPAWLEAMKEAGLTRPEDPKARVRYTLFVPTGQGRPFAVAVPEGFEANPGFTSLLPDGRVLNNVLKGGKAGWVVLDRRGGPPVRVGAPDGDWLLLASLYPLSPDATRLILSQDARDWLIQPLAGGRALPITGVQPGERVVGWSEDGRSVFVRTGYRELPLKVTRLDLASGARTPALTFTPQDPSGFLAFRDVFMSLDGRSCAASCQKKLSDLYLVEDLR